MTRQPCVGVGKKGRKGCGVVAGVLCGAVVREVIGGKQRVLVRVFSGGGLSVVVPLVPGRVQRADPASLLILVPPLQFMGRWTQQHLVVVRHGTRLDSRDPSWARRTNTP